MSVQGSDAPNAHINARRALQMVPDRFGLVKTRVQHFAGMDTHFGTKVLCIPVSLCTVVPTLSPLFVPMPASY
ncbi:hypothetical protein KDA_22540 [Dictyobacter alpinus]|uniref:Uncharacterized protein n=1 Tax=Dictyobacter alpinus TaxID=2014873 RepID=A0A402B614_9CHLR|nr:hypothetical protein KDA_22540 [Dictyobacter alpinus]